MANVILPVAPEGCLASITLWSSEEAISAGKADGPRKRGGQLRYSDGAIQCLLIVRSFFHQTLRATAGFVRLVFELIDLELEVADYTTIGKRSKQLQVCWPKKARGPLPAVLDRTGLKVFGECELFYSSRHSRRSHVQGNQFDLGNPGS